MGVQYYKCDRVVKTNAIFYLCAYEISIWKKIQVTTYSVANKDP